VCLCLCLCLEGSITVMENKRKGVTGKEMGVGPSRPFWIEVGDDRNEGKGERMWKAEYREAARDTVERVTSGLHCIPQNSLMAIVSVQWLLRKERSHATQLLSTVVVYLPRASVSPADVLKLHGTRPLSCCF
jgi:hypothetical protein